MMQILRWELRQRKGYIIGWSIACGLLVALLILLYPSIRDQANQLNKVLEQLPEALRALKAGDSSELFSPTGYLNSQLYYATLPLIMSIMAIGLGSSLLARDEQNHTLELLLARPISRSKVLLAKALTGIVSVGIVTIAVIAVTILLAQVVDMPVGWQYIAAASTFSALLALCFGAIAFTFTAVSQRTAKFAMPIAVFVGFGGYLLASLSGITDVIKEIAKLFPYHYYKPDQILNGSISKGLVAYLSALLLIAIVISWARFRKRDIA